MAAGARWAQIIDEAATQMGSSAREGALGSGTGGGESYPLVTEGCHREGRKLTLQKSGGEKGTRGGSEG